MQRQHRNSVDNSRIASIRQHRGCKCAVGLIGSGGGTVSRFTQNGRLVSRIPPRKTVISALHTATACSVLRSCTIGARAKPLIRKLPNSTDSTSKPVSRHASAKSTEVLQAPSPVSDNPSHIIPDEESAKAGMAAFNAAASAAEMKQQLLLSSCSSPLVQLVEQHPKLRTILEVYALVQSLHHQAIRQLLDQYDATAASLPALTYACLVDAVQQLNLTDQEVQVYGSKHYGDAISWDEMSSLYKQLISTTLGDSNDIPLSLVAEGLYLALTGGPTGTESSNKQLQLLSDFRHLVLPDVMTLLLDSLQPGAAAVYHLPLLQQQDAGGTAVAIGPGGQVQIMQDSSGHQAASNPVVVTERLVLQLLQQGLKRPAATDVPLRIEQIDTFVTALSGQRLHSKLCYVASLAQHSIRLLPSNITEPLDLHLGQVVQWASATPSLYYTHGLATDAAAVPALLVALLQHQLFASVAYSTAMEQLTGRLEPAADSDQADQLGSVEVHVEREKSWSPVMQLLSHLKLRYVPMSIKLQDVWVNTQLAAASLLTPDASLMESYTFVVPEAKMETSVDSLGLTMPPLVPAEVDTAYRSAELQIRSPPAGTKTGKNTKQLWPALERAVIISRLRITYEGPLYHQMLDCFCAGWYSLAYWADIVSLALECCDLAGPWPMEPAAAAAYLLQEKHSVMLERQHQRMLQLCMLSTPDRVKLKGVYTLTMPLPNPESGRNGLLARGHADDYADLQASYPAIPASVANRMQSERQSHGVDSRMAAYAVEQHANAPRGTAAAMHEKAVQTLQTLSGVLSDTAKSELIDLLLEEVSYNYDDDEEQNVAAAILIRVVWLLASGIGELAYGSNNNMPFLAYASSQLYTRSAASNHQVAELLLGPGAIAEEHLRPVQHAEAAMSATAAEIMRTLASSHHPTYDSVSRVLGAGITAANKQMPQHFEDAFDVLCRSMLITSSKPHPGLLRLLMKPMQLVGWETSQLPHELQGCQHWMQLSLGLWIGDLHSALPASLRRQRSATAAVCILQEMLPLVAEHTGVTYSAATARLKTGIRSLSALAAYQGVLSASGAKEVMQTVWPLPPYGYTGLLQGVAKSGSLQDLQAVWQLGLQLTPATMQTVLDSWNSSAAVAAVDSWKYQDIEAASEWLGMTAVATVLAIALQLKADMCVPMDELYKYVTMHMDVLEERQVQQVVAAVVKPAFTAAAQLPGGATSLLMWHQELWKAVNQIMATGYLATAWDGLLELLRLQLNRSHHLKFLRETAGKPSAAWSTQDTMLKTVALLGTAAGASQNATVTSLVLQDLSAVVDTPDGLGLETIGQASAGIAQEVVAKTAELFGLTEGTAQDETVMKRAAQDASAAIDIHDVQQLRHETAACASTFLNAAIKAALQIEPVEQYISSDPASAQSHRSMQKQPVCC